MLLTADWEGRSQLIRVALRAHLERTANVVRTQWTYFERHGHSSSELWT